MGLIISYVQVLCSFRLYGDNMRTQTYSKWRRSLSVLFCFLCAPFGEETGGELKEKEGRWGAQKACSIILILGCVGVTFGGMIVSHLGVWGVIFPPVWSRSPDLCKLAVKHIAARPSYPHMTCQYTQAEKALLYIQTFTQHIYIHASQKQLMPH